MEKDNHIALSFCFFGRNDNYTPDFLYRLTTTINFLAHSAKMVNSLDSIEILIVDWASEKHLKDSINLTPEGAQLARFIYIPILETVKYSAIGIPGNICANIALRRAKGLLVGVCGAEVLIPYSSIMSLLSLIENKGGVTSFDSTLYVCGRYRLPIEWVMSQPDIAQWQSYLLRNSWQIKQEPARGSFLTGNAGLFLIPRKILHESRGLLEELDPYWGWNDVEYTMRVISRYECVDLNSFGVTVFDMEHFSVKGDRSKIVKQPAKRLLSQHFCANDLNWGGKNLPIMIEKAESYSSLLESNFSNSSLIEETMLSNDILRKFFIWMSDHLVELPDEHEVTIIYILFQFVKKRNLLFYKEYGINQGHSFYLVGFLFKHSSLIGIDNWLMGGGEHGPDHIAYNLTTPVMQHAGHLRIINKNLLNDAVSSLSSIEYDDLNGVVLYRISDDDDLDSMQLILNNDIKYNDLMLIGARSRGLAEHILKVEFHLSLYSLITDDFSLLSHRSADVSYEGEQHLLFELSLLKHNSTNLTGLTNSVLFEKLLALKGKQLVIWGITPLTELIWPHISDNVVSVMTENLTECAPYRGKSISHNFSDFYNAELTIVRTF